MFVCTWNILCMLLLYFALHYVIFTTPQDEFYCCKKMVMVFLNKIKKNIDQPRSLVYNLPIFKCISSMHFVSFQLTGCQNPKSIFTGICTCYSLQPLFGRWGWWWGGGRICAFWLDETCPCQQACRVEAAPKGGSTWRTTFFILCGFIRRNRTRWHIHF